VTWFPTWEYVSPMLLYIMRMVSFNKWR
jgi:hypothetical protein